MHVYAGRVARVLLWMSHGCVFSRQMGGADETQEDDSKPICFVSASSERFRAHFAEDTTINSASKLPIISGQARFAQEFAALYSVPR